ncbi:hypothetical protein [Rhodovulum sulfidophilum]|uniref:hypothetical protein n=1 Tax=Rhodovulum sulfidophilum TaxID=35806 RepID=UPI0019141472|nr:hypothetical protein [Rhodovulum sulfidophilum]
MAGEDAADLFDREEEYGETNASKKAAAEKLRADVARIVGDENLFTFKGVAELGDTVTGWFIHTGDLSIGNFEARDLMRQELESFEADVGSSGRVKIEGGTKFGHADLAVSAALALWLSDHRSVGAHIGQVPLKGYW